MMNLSKMYHMTYSMIKCRGSFEKDDLFNAFVWYGCDLDGSSNYLKNRRIHHLDSMIRKKKSFDKSFNEFYSWSGAENAMKT